jgi:threonyl-tRNA synthetase
MFTTESEKHDYAIKPMNCPGHIQVFNSDLRSYRDLPLRYGEFGSCHRNEPSGALHGIMRVRGFVQDDGHIFCTEDQIQQECLDFTRLLQKVYADFGFTDIIYKLSTRPEKRVGSEESWDKAEKALSDSLNACGVPWEELKGEGAFYGPKIEYSLKDAIGRVWQLGTMQVDFNMPMRLGAEYVDDHSARQSPVMLHRAIVGSLERFIGILIENHSGSMPVWLAPVQVVAINVTEHQAAYVQAVTAALKAAGIRVVGDLRNEKISYKIREHSVQKVPFLLVLGDKEMQANTVTVRVRDGKGGGENLAPMTLDGFISFVNAEIATKHSS